LQAVGDSRDGPAEGGKGGERGGLAEVPGDRAHHGPTLIMAIAAASSRQTAQPTMMF
jgi:hypothetical protein